MVEVKVVKRMWRVSLTAMIAVGVFLGIRYLFTGSVPQTTGLKTTGQSQIVLSFAIIAFAGVWSALMVFIFSNKAMKADYIVVNLASGLTSGLIIGLIIGLSVSQGVGYGFNQFFSLAFGLTAGIVFGLTVDFGYTLGAGLVAGLTVGLGFSLVFFNLAVGLDFSLAFSLAVGLSVGLKFLFKNFRPLCQKTGQWLWPAA
jgi:hypothetical protein